MSSVAGPRRLRQLLDAVQGVSQDLDLPSMLRRITRSAVDLVDARYGALGVLDATKTRLAEFITVGIDDDDRAAIGHVPEGHGILGLLIVDARPLRLPDLTRHPSSHGFPPYHPPMHSFLGVPITVRDEVFGNLYLTDKSSAAAFTDEDEELVVGLASAAGVAIENARLSERVKHVALIEDRERIARDLHDTVIQRLFATGMSLQSTTRLVRADPDAAVDRIERAVGDLDTTINDIRTAIFELERHLAPAGGLRATLLDTVRDAAPALGCEPRLVLAGPIDSVVAADVAEALIATLREALSNVARHARATHVDVAVAADSADVVLSVSDDGVGLPRAAGAGSGKGLRNMTERAGRLGGACDTTPGPLRGTVVTWRVPVSAPAPGPHRGARGSFGPTADRLPR